MVTSRVRAKFRVDRYETQMSTKAVKDAEGNHLKNDQGAYRYEPVEMRTVVMFPVYSNDPQSENAKFWDATPSGEFKLGTINPEAWKHFQLGKEYYIDITPVE